MSTAPTTPTTPLLVFVSRIFWMMLGPAFLVMLAGNILATGAGWLTLSDAAFLAVLLGMVLARWYEFHRGDPRTSTGEPATKSHLHRYIGAVLTLGAGAWVAANVFGNHVLT